MIEMEDSLKQQYGPLNFTICPFYWIFIQFRPYFSNFGTSVL